jgi:hypothetical protein
MKRYFDEQDWDRIERDAMAWWAGELKRPLVWLAVTGKVPDATRHGFLTNYPLGMPVEDLIARYEPFLDATHFYGDSFPWWWINFGPGIAAGFLGARVHSVVDPSETVWFTPAEKKDIRSLTLRYDPENVWWKRVKEITAGIASHWGKGLVVSHTDLGGNLDILASFRETQTLLLDLIEDPGEVSRLVGEITRLWLRYYDELDTIIRPTCRGTSTWAPLYSTGKTYMLQSDFCYMISPKMFERFVLPDLVDCCSHLDHGFYHLDGKGQIPHLDHLLSISRLRGIQWIPGDGQPSPDQWLPLLKRIRDGGKLCQVYVSTEGALRIVRNLGGKGFLLVIQPANGEFDDPERAQAFLSQMAKEDISR